MRNSKVVVKRISDIIGMPTAHDIGVKKVLVSNTETDTSITQIAYTTLSMGDAVEAHTHPTMDEHFIILTGTCSIVCGEDRYLIIPSTYIYVPAGVEHRIEISEPLTMITIGIATE